MSHVDEGALHAYLDGALDEYPPADAERIREHLDQCGECTGRLEAERQIRSDAQAMLGMATPNVDMPSLEELRAYVKRTRPQRPTAAVRIYRMGWAASVVLAVGAGWMLRGGQLQDAGMLDGDFRRPAAEMVAPPPTNGPEERLEQTQDVEALEENTAAGALMLEVAPAVAFEAEEGFRGAGAEVPVTEVAAPSLDELQARADLPGDVVAKATTAEEDLPLESLVVTGATAGARAPEAQDLVGGVVGGAGVAVGEPESDARVFADEDRGAAAVDALTETVVALPAVGRLDDSVAGDVPARDQAAADADPEASTDGAERRRAESPMAVTSAMNRSILGNPRQAAENEPVVSEEPTLAVEGYALLSMVNLGEGTTPLGVHVVQSLDGDRTFEIYHLEIEVELSVLPVIQEGDSEVSVLTETGWIVMRGPLDVVELEALLARLFPEPGQ